MASDLTAILLPEGKLDEAEIHRRVLERGLGDGCQASLRCFSVA